MTHQNLRLGNVYVLLETVLSYLKQKIKHEVKYLYIF